MTDQDIHATLPEPVELDAPQPLTAEEIRARAEMREEVVTVEGVGPILMRTPTMTELADLANRSAGSPAEAGVQGMILCCPALSPADAEWLRAGNGLLLGKLAAALEEFGIQPVDVEKTAATFRAGSVHDVPVVPGGAAGDDTQPADA